MIKLSKSSISDAEKKAVMGVLDREYLGMGKEVQQFEEDLKVFFGRPVACVSSGTAALHLACQAAGLGSGDEVLVQSLTYVASFQAISATGATPVACDIDPVTLTLNVEDAENRITSKTKAVMPVHYAGGVGDLDGIYQFAKRHGLRVIEDAAHAFGSKFQGQVIGGFGDMACFSFDGIKNITSGEGGCIVSDDEVILQKVRDARLLGVVKDTERRFNSERSWDFDVTNQGWRYHMSNIMAAIGIEQLKRFPQMAAQRQRIAKKYDSLLSEVPNLEIFNHDYDAIVPHIYVIQCNGLSREKLRAILNRKDIQTGIHYQPNHSLSLYEKNSETLPIVDNIYPCLLSLPLHIDMTEDEVELICNELNGAIHLCFK